MIQKYSAKRNNIIRVYNPSVEREFLLYVFVEKLFCFVYKMVQSSHISIRTHFEKYVTILCLFFIHDPLTYCRIYCS